MVRPSKTIGGAVPSPPIGRLRRRVGRAGGFTLLELIVVIAIIGILAAIVLPALRQVPRRAQEAALRTNLRAFRDVIDQYYGDKGVYPPALQALVSEGYLRGVPIDPMTKSRDTWIPVYEDEVAPSTDDFGDEPAPEQERPEDWEPGVIDVRSGSDRMALDGTPYRDW